MIKVVVAGAAGRMGREVCKAVLSEPDMSLVGAVDVSSVGSDVGELLGRGALGVTITDKLETCLKEKSAQVMVDFTHPSAVMKNVRTALKCGVHAVVGTTGMSETDLAEIKSLAKDGPANVVVAPNFAIGAVLMMKFSEIAAKYLPDVEIIELHHNQKADAPSGTALKTAQLIAGKRSKETPPNLVEKEVVKGVRGGKTEDIHIHSVRLPGLVAHQEVIFGGVGQTLTIRHDSIDRSSFMPGVLMAIREVGRRRGLTYGLDKLMEL